jgi:TRAP-type C4-dicarboxylate transport system substrate-binding protein
MEKWRRSFLTGLLALIMALTLAACGGGSQTTGTAATQTPSEGTPSEATTAPQQEVWEYNLGTIGNDFALVPEFNSMCMGYQIFIDKAKEYTNGRINITPHWSGVLGTNVTMFEEVMMGELEFFGGQPMSSADKRFGAWNIPFMFDNLAQVKAAVDPKTGEVFKLASEWMVEKNVKLLAIQPAVFRGFISQKEVRVPADVSDLKIRTYEDALVNHFWGSLGTASIIAGSEIYSALQTKTVDAMEFHPTGVMSFKLYEVAKYFTELNWQWTCGAAICMPLPLWESWPVDVQDAVQRAATEAAEAQYVQELADEEIIYSVLEDNGMTVVQITPEERQQWINVARGMDDWFKEYVGADVFEKYVAAIDAAKTAAR